MDRVYSNMYYATDGGVNSNSHTVMLPSYYLSRPKKCTFGLSSMCML